jgi:DNA-binding LytR/AlgR family response regulator
MLLYDVSAARDGIKVLDVLQRPCRTDLLFSDVVVPRVNRIGLAAQMSVLAPGSIIHASGMPWR